MDNNNALFVIAFPKTNTLVLFAPKTQEQNNQKNLHLLP